MTVVNCLNYSDDSKSSWKRPEGPPRIWRVYEGRKKSEYGTIPRFSIQDIPEEMIEEVIDFMLKYILEEEDFAVTLGLAKDQLAIEDIRTFWRKTMCQGMSIVALAGNTDPGAKPVIAGANILNVVTDQDKAGLRSLGQFKTKQVKTFFGTVFNAEDEVDIFTKYGVDKYLASVGLLVHPSFRGHGIGAKLLKARDDIGRTYQITATKAMFTTKMAQIAGSRAGFELQLEKKFSELLDHEGNLIFPEETGKVIHVMTKRLC